jgi:hypothetical protein
VVVVEARLSNPKYTGNSSTSWYVVAGPIDVPIIAGFLDGKQNPTIETFGLSAEINTLGYSWRAYLDAGCSLGEYRAGVKATGATAA